MTSNPENDKLWYDLGIRVNQMDSRYNYIYKLIVLNFGLSYKYNRNFHTLDKYFLKLKDSLDTYLCNFYPNEIKSLNIDGNTISITKLFYNSGESIVAHPNTNYTKNKQKMLFEVDKQFIESYLEDFHSLINDIVNTPLLINSIACYYKDLKRLSEKILKQIEKVKENLVYYPTF